MSVSGAKSRSVRNLSCRAYLAVRSGRTVSTDHLIDAIWAGDPPRTALTALHVYVCRLRQRLKAAGSASDDLATRPPGYLLNLNRYAFDLRTFDELTIRAQQAESIGDLPGSAALLGEALALWQGPPLRSPTCGTCRCLPRPRT
ncbi:helix-turn-helix domain-containing protein [Solwaraspora sp. WMMA2065]|uniref:AfsR/SARP family transcriptional regulator n=1 Tax=Solwaraspora sp. WMMA2065 TaxID=3015166 RepID=UPI00259BADBA|nr:helix-turn-helix domain-containing protein [Solwaraspora sp. WMMA2065]WJK33674.1 helix-turn-helix domain-containing protein [Solwaraspora sp. WMMA2065]